jgi:hypothetical protein
VLPSGLVHRSSGAFGPGTVQAPAVKKEEASSSDFKFGSDDDDCDGADNALVFSTFDHRYIFSV